VAADQSSGAGVL